MIFTSGATASLKLIAESFEFQPNEAFHYLTDSHTSVLGMREIVNTENIIPIAKSDLLNKETGTTKGLVVFPAQCNYNGLKYPLDLTEDFHKSQETSVCLDAASFVSTNFLDLQRFKPDYVCLSFYKIFGYPTGLGALLVSKRGEQRLKKKYYGGGTVKIALTRTNWHEKRDAIHERFEDGTIDYLSIIALQTCFQFMESLLGFDFIHRISRHVFNVGKYLHHQLASLKHHNGQSVVTFHHDTKFQDIKSQGGIVNFSLRHADGSFVGFAEFSSIAALHSIILRTGCFCNPGSCQTHLNLSTDDLMKQFNAGHVCGDDNDLIDGSPTGSIRASFGYMTRKENVDKLVEVIRDCYAEKAEKAEKTNRLTSNVTSLKPILKEIQIYPIKSCGAMVIDGSWMITPKGFKYDREWAIVNGSNGTSLTQKNETRMCMIRPSIDEDRMVMRLDFPYASSIEVSLLSDQATRCDVKICETKVCGDRIQGVDCGDEVAAWVSDVLAIEDLRLIRHTENIERKNGAKSLSNQAQFLLISEPSVKWLMNQVEQWDDTGTDVAGIVKRFRGNLVIDSIEPLCESNFKNIQIGRAKFEVQGPCTRCQMICIDQENGEKTTEPLRTIGKLFKGKMRFGIYLRHSNLEDLSISCGDELTVNEK